MRSFRSYVGPAGAISFVSLAASWLAIILLITHMPYLAIYSAVSAFFLDSLDCYVARKTNTESDFGRQLDSMLDFFNYSVFAALLYFLYVSSDMLGFFVGFLILLFGAFRLVRFNVEGMLAKKSNKYYEGVVVCMVSLAVVVIFLINKVTILPTIFSALVITSLSFLQASRIPVRKTNYYFLWAAVAVGLVIFTYWVSLWKR